MAQSLAFNVSGANPLGTVQTNQTSTPAFGSKATGPYLSNTKNVNPDGTTSTSSNYNYGSGRATIPGTNVNPNGGAISLGTNPGLIPPSTPVKSHTVTNVDGSTVTQTYHTPATSTNTSSTPSVTASSPAPQSNSVDGANASIASNGGVALSAQGLNANYTGNIKTSGLLNSNDTIGNSQSQNIAGQPLQSSTGNPATSSNPGNATSGFLPNNSQLGTIPRIVNSSSSAHTPGTFNANIENLSNTQNSPYNQSVGNSIGLLNQTGAGNIPLGQNAQNIADTAGNEIKQLGILGSGGGGYAMSGANPGMAAGADLAFRNAIANEEQAVAAGANTQLQGNTQALTGQNQAANAYGAAAGAANTGQSNVQGATSNAAGYTQPQFGSYGQASYDPTTGTYTPASAGASNAGSTGYTGIPYIDNAVNTAFQSFQNGGSLADAYNAVGGQYSVAGEALSARVAAANGGSFPNQTAQNASASQTASQGASAQGQAFNLDTALKQVASITPLATNFLNSYGLLNQTGNKLIDQPISNYINTIANGGATATYNELMTSLNAFKAQITNGLSSGSLTPTATTAFVASTDPSSLTAPQLQAYMQNVASIGGNELGVFQGQARNSGATGYAGSATPQTTSLVVPPAGSSSNLTPNNYGALAGGAGLTYLPAVWNDVVGLGKTALSYVLPEAGAAAGAASALGK